MFEHPHDARHSDREAADGDLLPRARRTVRIQEETFVGGGRCSLAPVVSLHDSSRRVVIEQEAPAADPGRLRLDEAQHHLCRDCRVDGVAAGFQDAGARLGGGRMSRRDHRVLRTDRGVVRTGTRRNRQNCQCKEKQRGNARAEPARLSGRIGPHHLRPLDAARALH